MATFGYYVKENSVSFPGMDWDVIDGLTMVPGLLGSYWFAWSSNDFVYRIAVLAWGWVCLCSMAYHFSNCEQKLLKYDQRAQWVSQMFMTLETPQSSWPIVVGGMIPVGWKGRAVINAAGALWFARHQPASLVILLVSYAAYLLQFPLKRAWLHSVFHMLLHTAGCIVALNPVKKYTVPVHADWAWLFFVFGAVALMPSRQVMETMWVQRTRAS
jgi:hypothetical protein